MNKPKTYKMSKWLYHEGGVYERTIKGVKKKIKLGKIVQEIERPGTYLNPIVIVEYEEVQE